MCKLGSFCSSSLEKLLHFEISCLFRVMQCTQIMMVELQLDFSCAAHCDVLDKRGSIKQFVQQ